jgi:hypothetical protein
MKNVIFSLCRCEAASAEAIQRSHPLDCFASLAMTGLERDADSIKSHLVLNFCYPAE